MVFNRDNKAEISFTRKVPKKFQDGYSTYRETRIRDLLANTNADIAETVQHHRYNSRPHHSAINNDFLTKKTL